MKITLSLHRNAMCSLRLARNLSLLVAGVMLAGCPAGNQAPPAGSTASATGKVVIRGSNTVGEELGPRLIVEFKKDHPTADFDLETKATGYGLAALRAGQCDIAAASRPATKEEIDEAQRMGLELADHPIGAYSVAVIVHAGSAVTNLTRAQVRDIFTGVISNWKDIGGPDSPIHVYARDPISGTYLGFKELAMDNKDYAAGRRLASSYREIVTQVAQDESGIGYSSVELPKDAGVSSVSIDGVPATAVTVNGGKYPYIRVLHLYTNKAQEAGTAKDFVQFVLSAHGQEILAQMGFVPLH